jgi:hypothetical protein
MIFHFALIQTIAGQNLFMFYFFEFGFANYDDFSIGIHRIRWQQTGIVFSVLPLSMSEIIQPA